MKAKQTRPLQLKKALGLSLFLNRKDNSDKMEKETKVATEDPKIDLFEDDDEFEEFEINEEWDEKEGKETTQQWEDDWDDDDVSDDFSLQLRRELENTEKS